MGEGGLQQSLWLYNKKERQAGTCTLLSMMSLEKGLFSQARHRLAFSGRYHMVSSFSLKVYGLRECGF